MLVFLHTPTHVARLMATRLNEWAHHSSPQGLRLGFSQIEQAAREFGMESINLGTRKKEAFTTVLERLCNELEQNYPIIDAAELARKKVDCDICLEELAPPALPLDQFQKLQNDVHEAQNTSIFHRGIVAIQGLEMLTKPMEHQQIEASAKHINSIFREIDIDLVSPQSKIEIILQETKQDAWRNAHIRSGLMLLEAVELAIGNGHVKSQQKRHSLVADCKTFFDWPAMALDEAGSGQIPGYPLTMRQRLRAVADGYVMEDILSLANPAAKNGISLLASLPQRSQKILSLRLV